MKCGLKIGEIAKLSGVSVETVRFYERRGLIEEPPRTESGYRQYSRSTANRILFIKRTQELGFTLKEIKELLKIASNNTMGCGEIRNFSQSKIIQISEKIKHLKKLKKGLEILVKNCPGKGSVNGCPIVDSMLGDN